MNSGTIITPSSYHNRSVMQDWTFSLSFMQQSVLITAIRGPDGIHKNHVSKKLIRWLRRCVLISAFDGEVRGTPWEPGGGSFTGPSLPYVENCVTSIRWQLLMSEILDLYMLTLDEIPHHFQLHFLHATEILGYRHPERDIMNWWRTVYARLCNDMHLNVETEEQMEHRLGDNERNWRGKEEVRAD